MTNQLPHRHQPEHEIYLLRVWYEPSERMPAWRASLHLPHGAPRRYFATRAALLTCLLELLNEPEPNLSTESS